MRSSAGAGSILRRHGRWLLALGLLWLPAVAAAEERPAASAEDIVKGLLGPSPEAAPAGEPPFETRGAEPREGIITRGIGGVRPGRRPPPPPAPTPAVASSPGPGRIALPIQFRYDSAEITEASLPQLVAVAQALNDPRLQGVRVRIEGHTDALGSEEYNLRLSERRAEAVRRFLVERGQVAAARLEARGFGKSRPLADVAQHTEEGRARNRRVEFVNLGPAAEVAQAGPEPEVRLVVGHERDGRPRTLTPGAVLLSGESYRVTFTPSADAFVYVFLVDAAGQARPLFPNPDYSPAVNPVKGGQAYRLPADGRGLTPAGPPGDAEIVVVAARRSLPEAPVIAARRPAAPLVLTRGPAPRPRGDAGPEAPPGVFTYRLPFEHR